jgi:3-hydroxyisobutyrate dehydrogenase
MTAPRARIAFIGLGHMGAPMVRRLLGAGYAVAAYDVQAAAREQALTDGAAVPGGLAETVRDADLVILMLPDSRAVAGVLRDTAARDALRPGSVVVDMGSSEPEMTRELGAELAARDVGLVDAPVSGGVAGAESGSLSIMAGGSDDDMARVDDVLGAMGQVVRAGPLGAGHAVKALNNLLSATHLWITCEAIAAGQRFGLDAATLLEIFNRSSGRSGSTQNKWPNFILNERYSSGFALRLMAKDVQIADDLARGQGAFHELARTVGDLWRRAADELPPTADHTEVARWIASAGERDGGLHE